MIKLNNKQQRGLLFQEIYQCFRIISLSFVLLTLDEKEQFRCYRQDIADTVVGNQ